MAKMTWDDVEKQLKELGFGVSNWQTNGGMRSCSIQKYSPAGQDCVFTLFMRRNNPSSVADAMDELWESYDPDRETMRWVDRDGHGINGAPFYLSDVLKDMLDVDDDLKYSRDEMRRFVLGFKA